MVSTSKSSTGASVSKRTARARSSPSSNRLSRVRSSATLRTDIPPTISIHTNQADTPATYITCSFSLHGSPGASALVGAAGRGVAVKIALMRLTSSFLTFLLLASYPGFGQELLSKEQMKQTLDLSQKRGQLEREGAPPFHLVASFERLDVTGKSLGKGSLDELWENPKRYRKVLTISGRRLVEADNGTQAWRTGEWVLQQSVDLGVMAALTPFRERPEGGRTSPQASPKDNGDLDCIGTEPELQSVSEAPPLPLTTYCMEKGNHLLRLISRPNSIEISFNTLEPFGKGYIPRTVQVALKGKGSLRLHVDKLEPATDFNALASAPPADAQLLPFHRAEQPWRNGEFMHAQLLSKVSPQYPQTGMNGNLVVKLHIDKTGAVSVAEILSSGNQILKTPILTAVRQWKYRPAYQSGELREDEQTIHFTYGKEDAE